MPLARIPLDRHEASSSSLISPRAELDICSHSLPILRGITFSPAYRLRHPSLNPDGVKPRWLGQCLPVILRKHTARSRVKLPER